PPTRWPTAAAWALLKDPAVLALVGSAGVMSLAVSVFYAFYPGYLEGVGIDRKWVGLIVSIGVAVEIVCMLGFGWVLHRVGVRGVMILGAASTAVRLALLALVPGPGVAIATQILHGPFVLSLYVAPQLYLNHKADDHFRNSVLGMYAMLIFGVARLAGGAAGGHVAEAVGGDRLLGLRSALGFGAVAAAVAVGWLAIGFRDELACRGLRDAHPQGD
ncbi:MAG: MFS transporter, partial [Phycisphaeraceae bacterium]|nr:MFS transporter [Phycisphaeraceae bacterium]